MQPLPAPSLMVDSLRYTCSAPCRGNGARPCVPNRENGAKRGCLGEKLHGNGIPLQEVQSKFMSIAWQ
jgi:hypothetical protein